MGWKVRYGLFNVNPFAQMPCLYCVSIRAGLVLQQVDNKRPMKIRDIVYTTGASQSRYDHHKHHRSIVIMECILILLR